MYFPSSIGQTGRNDISLHLTSERQIHGIVECACTLKNIDLCQSHPWSIWLPRQEAVRSFSCTVCFCLNCSDLNESELKLFTVWILQLIRAQNKAIAMTLMALCQKSVYFEQKKPWVYEKWQFYFCCALIYSSHFENREERKVINKQYGWGEVNFYVR